MLRFLPSGPVVMACMVAAALSGCTDHWVDFDMRKQVRAPVTAFDVSTAPYEVVVQPRSLRDLLDRVHPAWRTSGTECNAALTAEVACACTDGSGRPLCCDLDAVDSALRNSCGVATGLSATVDGKDVFLDWLIEETRYRLGRRIVDDSSDPVVLYDLEAYRSAQVAFGDGTLSATTRHILRDVPVHLRIVKRYASASDLLGSEVDALQKILERPEIANISVRQVVLRTMTDEELATAADPVDVDKEIVLDARRARCQVPEASQPRMYSLIYARLGACFETESDPTQMLPTGWPLLPDGTVDTAHVGTCVPVADGLPVQPDPGVQGAVLLDREVAPLGGEGDCVVRIDRPTGESLVRFVRADVRNLDLVVDLESPLPFRDPTPGPCDEDPSQTCYVSRPIYVGGYLWVRVALRDLNEQSIPDIVDAL